MSPTVYLITGANRGLGRGLLTALIQRPETTVIAGVRDPSHATSESLLSLPTGIGSKIVLVKLDSASETDALEAVKSLQSTHSITHIDVIIANAGISKHYGPPEATPVSEVREHFDINATGPLLLFQATLPLLEKSAKPKFVPISTAVASIGDMDKIPLTATAYGMSKAALNYLTKRIHQDYEKIIAFPLNPGWVQTEMGNTGAKANGLDQAPLTLEESVNGMLNKIDNATREQTSGTFQSFDDLQFSW